MRSYESQFRSLRALITAKQLFELDPALQAAIAQHACVRAVGLTEIGIRSALCDHVGLRSSPEVVSYVRRQASLFYNPKYKPLRALLETFSSNWAAQLDDLVTTERRDMLNSIVENKNRIAHGDSVSVSVGTIEPHVQNCEWICAQIRVITK